MRRIFGIIILACLPVILGTTLARAEQATFAPQPAGDHELADFLWTDRLLLVFADSPNDPRFVQQMEFLAADPEELEKRDIIVITDTAPSDASALRTALRPRGFMLVLIGKDGAIYLRKPLPWRVRELMRSVDKMPIRQQELRDSRLGS